MRFARNRVATQGVKVQVGELGVVAERSTKYFDFPYM